MALLPRLDWRWMTFLLCLYGFWKEMRPVTPFLTPFLRSPSGKNLTLEELYSSVFPFWTYSYLLMLIPVFVLTDLVRSKPLIVSESLGYVATWALLIWADGVPAMQAMQVCYGWATATEVAYYAYIYAVIDAAHFQKATSYVRAAVLIGRCVAYALGQALLSSGVADFAVLNYISLTAVGLIFFIALALPNSRPPSSARKEEEAPLRGTNMATTGNLRAYFKDILAKFVRCYSNRFVLRWSLWWALATCGFFQVGNYIQTLWDVFQSADESHSTVYNGVIEAVSTLLCAGVAVLVQWIRLNWALVGEAALGSMSLVAAALLFLMATSGGLAAVYAAYVGFCVLYQALITIATFNIASSLEESSAGLVFGANTFLALLLQTGLTFSVADAAGLNLHIRDQFLVYAGWHVAMGAVFLAMGVGTLHSFGWRRAAKHIRKAPPPPEESDRTATDQF